MPKMPPTFRPHRARTDKERRKDYEDRRRARDPGRTKRYQDPRWRARCRYEKTSNPYCWVCRDVFGKTVLATDVNHIEPHHGDIHMFLTGPVETLCRQCHGHISGCENHGGVPYDGAIDKRGDSIAPGHWFYKKMLDRYGPRRRKR